MVGIVASVAAGRRGEAIVLDAALGVVGAVLAGFVFAMLGLVLVGGLGALSIVGGLAGAVVVLAAYHAITARVLRVSPR